MPCNAIVNSTGLVAVVALPQFEVLVIMAGIVVLAAALIVIVVLAAALIVGTGNDAMESKHRNRQQQPSRAKRDHQEPASIGDQAAEAIPTTRSPELQSGIPAQTPPSSERYNTAPAMCSCPIGRCWSLAATNPQVLDGIVQTHTRLTGAPRPVNRTDDAARPPLLARV